MGKRSAHASAFRRSKRVCARTHARRRASEAQENVKKIAHDATWPRRQSSKCQPPAPRPLPPCARPLFSGEVYFDTPGEQPPCWMTKVRLNRRGPRAELNSSSRKTVAMYMCRVGAAKSRSSSRITETRLPPVVGIARRLWRSAAVERVRFSSPHFVHSCTLV